MKKLFFAALAATILFASCAKDGNDGFKNEEGPQTGMSISFTMPQALESRAITGDGITGTADENKFTKVKVFIFNSSGGSVEGNNTERLEADFDKNGNTYTLKATKQIKTTAGPKRIYVGVNLPTGFDSFNSEDDLKKAKGFVAADMVSATNGAAMISEVIVTTLVAQEDADVVNPDNKISADVERMVAKVAANTTSTNNMFVSNLSADVLVTYEIISWGIGHGTNLMYPAKQFENSKLVTPRNTDSTPAVNGAPVKNDLIAISNASFTNDWTGMSSTYVGENAPKDKLVGESTYALIQTKAAPNKKALFNGTSIDWSAHTFSDDFWVVRSSGDVYFCESEIEGRKVYDHLREGGASATIQLYQGGYVYFVAWLNRNVAGEELIVKRNQYIHIEIAGVKEGLFGGIPGDPTDPTGTTPPDPTDSTQPEEPDPLDPEDPVFTTDAYLNVTITVKPWVYVKNSTILE